MSLFKRHIGRRVTVVGVGVALLMLGLEAPAFAAPPTIASFTPTSGPETGGCVVVITGTALDDFPRLDLDTKLEFVDNLIPATFFDADDFSLISDTEIWAVAPAALVSGRAYNIRFSNDGGTNTSTGTFLATAGAGACGPTIASFTPTCGLAGAVVTITGTNLLTDLGGVDSIDGGAVRFSPYAADAAGTVPDIDSATTLGVIRPTVASDGPIRVTTFLTTGGTANSTASFETPPPDCEEEGVVTHSRSVTLSLRKHLVARGAVSVGDGFTECAASVPVKIQRRVSGAWRTVGSTTTTDTGAYKKAIKDKPGKYRARATKVSIGDPVTDICAGARSPVRRHTH